jgi:microcystin-dependent protein
MPEMPNVVLDETIETEWGNDIRDRTVQRYETVTERDALHTSPADGDLSYIESTGDIDYFHLGQWRHVATPVGMMQMHGGGLVPTGWLLCNGAAVSRVTYAALFAQIGTAWGAGDGTTTFNIPEMRGRVPRGVATSGPGSGVGQQIGADTHAHAGAPHAHNNPNTNNAADHQHHNDHVHSSPFHGSSNATLGAAVGQEGSGPTFQYATMNHQHNSIAGLNTGGSSNGWSTANGAHGHSQGPTDSQTGTTGTASTMQAGAAVNFIIKT